MLHPFRRFYQLSLRTGLFIVLAVYGCQTIPADALRLNPESLKQRQMQTRRFDGISEKALLAASAGVIQDLGFNIDEAETELGLIVGSKERDAKEASQIAVAIIVALLGGGNAPIENRQVLRLSLVIRPARNTSAASFLVRVTFQRMVWDTNNQITRAESINDMMLYQEFFERLSKSVFLEAHLI